MSAPAYLPPHNIEAEQGLLGAILFDNSIYEKACERLRGRHFYDPVHGRIFDVIEALVQNKRLADAVTLREHFVRDGAIQEIGGAEYIITLLECAARIPTHAREYAEIIFDFAMRRKAIGDINAALIKLHADSETRAIDQLVALERQISTLASVDLGEDQFKPLHEIMADAVASAREGRAKGLSTGIVGLDELTGGFVKGHFWAEGGYAKQGKTTLSQHHGNAIAVQGKAVLRFDFEMTEEDVGLRHASAMAYDPSRPIIGKNPRNPSYIAARRAVLDDEQWGWLEDAAARAKDLPIWVSTRRGMTVAQMMASARRQIRRFQRQQIETGLIIIDHTTLVHAELDRRGNKAAETADIADEITGMGKELNTCVLGLCQITRAGAEADRPQKQHLAWSANLERNANVIALIHRPAAKLEAKVSLSIDEQSDLQDIKNHMAIYVDGNRNGPTGSVTCRTDLGSAVVRDAPELKDYRYK